MNLFETLEIAVVACIIFKILQFILIVWIEWLDYSYSHRIDKKSEYREAFMLECSEDMLKDKNNNYARNLDAAISRIDKEEEKVSRAREKANKRIQNINN